MTDSPLTCQTKRSVTRTRWSQVFRRRARVENALVAAFTNPAQLKATTDNSLCHGFAGLAHVAARAAPTMSLRPL